MEVATIQAVLESIVAGRPDLRPSVFAAISPSANRFALALLLSLLLIISRPQWQNILSVVHDISRKSIKSSRTDFTDTRTALRVFLCFSFFF